MNKSHRLGSGAVVVVALGVVAAIGAGATKLDRVAVTPQFLLAQGPEVTVYLSPT